MYVCICDAGSLFLPIWMYVWSTLSAEYRSTGRCCQSCSWTSKEEKITCFLSSFAPENVVSRDRFDGPVPRQPAAHSPHSRLNVVLIYGIPSIQYYSYVEQTASAVESRACVREICAIHFFYGFLGFDATLAGAAIRTTDAVVVLAPVVQLVTSKPSDVGT